MTNIKTPVGRVSYPNLLKPKLNDMNPATPKMEYSVDLLFSKDTDISVIKAAVDKAIAEKWGAKKPADLINPIKDGDVKVDKNGEPVEAYANCFYITLKNTRKPNVVDANVQPIMSEEEIYGGCYGRASFTAYAYPKLPDPRKKRGVSLSLVNFQKVKDGEPFGSVVKTDAEVDFDVMDEEADNEANYAPAPAKKKSILG